MRCKGWKVEDANLELSAQEETNFYRKWLKWNYIFLHVCSKLLLILEYITQPETHLHKQRIIELQSEFLDLNIFMY